MLNPSAFRAGTRESRLDDGVNLNRAFVDGAGKNPALRGSLIASRPLSDSTSGLACMSSSTCIPVGTWPDFRLCQLSSGRRSRSGSQDRRNRPLVRHASLMVYQNHTPGLLPSEAERLGKITVGTELGWGCAVNPRASAMDGMACWRPLIHNGLLQGDDRTDRPSRSRRPR